MIIMMFDLYHGIGKICHCHNILDFKLVLIHEDDWNFNYFKILNSTITLRLTLRLTTITLTSLSIIFVCFRTAIKAVPLRKGLIGIYSTIK